MNSLNGPKIICGDFNLRPGTQSIEIIENDLTNLIRVYDIHDTRTSYYKKSERYADYIFTSQGIAVHDFQVLNEEVSDHVALQLDFSVMSDKPVFQNAERAEETII